MVRCGLSGCRPDCPSIRRWSPVMNEEEEISESFETRRKTVECRSSVQYRRGKRTSTGTGATTMASENHGAVLRGHRADLQPGVADGPVRRAAPAAVRGRRRGGVRGPGDAARADGPGRLPAVAPRSPRRRGRLSGHVPRPAAEGRRSARRRAAWALAARRGVSRRRADPGRRGPAARPRSEGRPARGRGIAACDLERTELRTLLDEEIGRLPEKYRRPVVLCYLEGRNARGGGTAAAMLGGERARAARPGAAKAAGPPDPPRPGARRRADRTGGGGEVASAAVPAPLVAATVATLARAATATAVSATASTAALELADGVFRAMIVAKLKLAALLVVGILALGALPLVVALEARAAWLAVAIRRRIVPRSVVHPAAASRGSP